LPQTRRSEVIRGKRRIATDTALRLSQAFGLSERYWLNIQNDYDIELEHQEHDADLRRSKGSSPPDDAGDGTIQL
jgi:plasmid maintenance system antidote protein VapI